jgi:hypothetical protein
VASTRALWSCRMEPCCATTSKAPRVALVEKNAHTAQEDGDPERPRSWSRRSQGQSVVISGLVGFEGKPSLQSRDENRRAALTSRRAFRRPAALFYPWRCSAPPGSDRDRLLLGDLPDGDLPTSESHRRDQGGLSS